jgi:hypothetical protein
MSGNLVEIKQNLRKFEFPYSAREALEHAGLNFILAQIYGLKFRFNSRVTAYALPGGQPKR